MRWPGIRKDVRAPVTAASPAICRSHLQRAIRGAQGVLPCVGSGVTDSQLDLPSLTPLSVAGWLWSTVTGSSPLGNFISITANS